MLPPLLVWWFCIPTFRRIAELDENRESIRCICGLKELTLARRKVTIAWTTKHCQEHFDIYFPKSAVFPSYFFPFLVRSAFVDLKPVETIYEIVNQGFEIHKNSKFHSSASNSFLLKNEKEPLIVLPSKSETYIAQHLPEKCISEVMRFSGIVTFHLKKLWKASSLYCGMSYFWWECRENANEAITTTHPFFTVRLVPVSGNAQSARSWKSLETNIDQRWRTRGTSSRVSFFWRKSGLRRLKLSWNVFGKDMNSCSLFPLQKLSERVRPGLQKWTRKRLSEGSRFGLWERTRSRQWGSLLYCDRPIVTFF